jgi:rod shape-determining protein MreB
MTEIEKRAYYTIASSGDLRRSKVFLVEKPIADAIGLGIPIMKTNGSMLVNIGGESTEISVIADQRVIISKVLPVGGNSLDTAICNAVRKRTSTHIGHRTGTRLKNALAYFQSGAKEARKVVGIDSISGLPKTAIVTAGIVNTAIDEPIRRIADEIQTFLDRTPPQIRSVIL